MCGVGSVEKWGRVRYGVDAISIQLGVVCEKKGYSHACANGVDDTLLDLTRRIRQSGDLGGQPVSHDSFFFNEGLLVHSNQRLLVFIFVYSPCRHPGNPGFGFFTGYLMFFHVFLCHILCNHYSKSNKGGFLLKYILHCMCGHNFRPPQHLLPVLWGKYLFFPF